MYDNWAYGANRSAYGADSLTCFKSMVTILQWILVLVLYVFCIPLSDIPPFAGLVLLSSVYVPSSAARFPPWSAVFSFLVFVWFLS